jgi:site-specific DNA recombinase
MAKTARTRTRQKAQELQTPKAVIYARVSSREQEREGFSIPAQLKLLRDHAEANGLDVAGEYVDVETAKQSGRTNFDEMIRYLRKHKAVQTILVEKTDRLYRNLKDWVTIDELDAEIHLVKEGIALSRESRSSEKFMHGIKVLMAKNYIDNLSEEVRKGMLEKAEQGLWPSAAPFGYRNVVAPDGKKGIAVDPDQGPIITRLFEWYATGGYSLKEIGALARAEGLAYRKSQRPVPVSTVHKILRSRLYTGEFEWRGKVYQGSHEPLISKDLWASVQDILDGRNNKTRHPKTGGGVREFAFTGLISCGHCGCAVTAEIKKGKYIYYHCTGFRGKCPEKFVREEVLEEQFSGLLAKLRFDEEVYDLIVQALKDSFDVERHDHDEAVASLRAESDRLRKRLEAVYVDKLDGTVTDDFYRRMAVQWREELDRCQRDLARHQNASNDYMDEGVALLTLARKAHRLFEGSNAVEKRRLLTFVLSNCTWKHGELTADYRQPFDLLAQVIDDTDPSQGGGNAATPINEKWSGRQDSNLRPSAPKADALPGCATPRRREPSMAGRLPCVKDLPDADALVFGQIKLLARFYIEGRIPSIEITHGGWPPVAGRMGIRRELLPKLGVAVLLPPDLRVAEEESLIAGEAADHGRGLPAKRCLIGVVGDGEARDVGDVLAQRQFAIDVRAGKRLVGTVLRHNLIGIDLEALHVLGGPPVGELAGRIILAALIIEMVRDLVADHRADRTVVDRRVSVRIEERRLQDGRGEHHLVHRRVRIGVHRLGRHEPLVAVDGFAQLGEVSVIFERSRALRIAKGVARFDFERRIIDPLRRIADLRLERGKFGARLHLRLGCHPR